MKRNRMIGLLAAMLLVLSACGAKQEETPPEGQDTPPVSQQEETPQTGEGTDAPQTGESNAPAIPAVVSIGYASDALLADEAAFDLFTDNDSEYQIKAVFTTNTAVQDFRYVELGFDENGQGDDPIRFHVEKELYGAAELSPDRPLVISMVLDGLLPNRGISYVDETGAVRYFTLEMSGEDSSLFLSEFTPA